MIFGSKETNPKDLFEQTRENKLVEFLAGERTPAWKAVVAFLSLIVVGMVLYFSGYTAMLVDAVYGPDGNLMDATQKGFFAYIIKAVTSVTGWTIIVLLTVVLVVGVLIMCRKNKDLDQVKMSDERGVDFAENGTYGTAEWLSKPNAKKIFEVGPIDNVSGVILGQYSSGGKEVICLPKDTKSNRNIIILGSPGTGKSWCYVRNAIFQSVVREESIIITDPKGELYESTAAKLKEEGYKVWVYNLVDPRRSDAWDILSEIYDPETGDVSDIRVTEFCDTVMKNTIEGPDDQFWGAGESNLFKAVVTYCAWAREEELKALYESEGKNFEIEIGDKMSEEDKLLLISVLEESNQNVTMKEREQALLLLLKVARNEDFAKERLAEIKRAAHPCDMASIYYMISTCDINALAEKFKPVPLSHPAGIAWNIFQNAGDNTKPGFVSGLAQRLQLFQTRDIRRITTNDTIHFADLGSEKIALFCIISDKSQAMRALTSLFFTFVFKDIADAADRYGPENRKYVNVICDEFANLGVIPGFDTTISTVRSRKINISIILQSVMQLEARYKDTGEIILSCCDTLLFLGCNDNPTAEYMSALSGVSSIRVVSTKDSRSTSLGNRMMMQGYQLSEGDGKRNLMNPDEVKRLPIDEVLIYHKGQNILKAKKCGYDNHRFSREGLPPATPLREFPLARDKYILNEALDAFVMADIENRDTRNWKVATSDPITKPQKVAIEETEDEPSNPNRFF